MNMVAINGSPKADGGASRAIIGQIERMHGEAIPAFQAAACMRRSEGETLTEAVDAICRADALVIAFPLYVDGLPAPLVALLLRVESALRERAYDGARGPRVYAIANCGFHEAGQNALALRMAHCFADRCGLPWGYGLGIGGGPVLAAMGDDWAKGPSSGAHGALRALVEAARAGGGGEDVFVSVGLPRALYRMGAHMGWRRMARENGVAKEVGARPYA